MLKKIQIIGYNFIYTVKIKKINMKTLIQSIKENLGNNEIVKK